MFLQSLQRISAEWQRVQLRVERLLNQLDPGAAARFQAKRKCVQKEAGDAVAVRFLRTPVRYDSGKNIALAGFEADDTGVRSQQHTLDRYACAPRNMQEPLGQLVRYRHDYAFHGSVFR